MATTDIERLVVQLSADFKKFENALNRQTNQANKQFRAIEKRAVEMNKNLENSFSSLGTNVAKAFALIGGAKGLQELADSAIKIENAMKVAGLSGDSLTKTLDQLYGVALKNHIPIEALAQLYSRVSLQQKELGASSQQLVGFTDLVGKALRVSGTSATEAAGPMLQLAQALGSGTVHAEEFNSIIEGMPALAQAAAKGIKQANGSVAELKNLVNNGKISSRALFDGIIAGASDLDTKLAGTQTTIGQAFTDLQTSLTKAVGKFNEASGAGNAAISVIENAVTRINQLNFNQLAENIQAVIAWLNNLGKAYDNLLAGASASGGSLNDKLQSLSKSINGGKPLIDLGPAFSNQPIDIEKLGREYDERQKHADGERLKALQDQLDAANELQKAMGLPLNNDANAEILRQMDAIREKTGAAKDEVVSLQEAARSTAGPQGPPDLRKFQKSEGFKDELPLSQPIDITDKKYATTPTKTPKEKSGGADAKAYDREVRQVRERTAVLNAQTEAQSKLNPYINDYGYAAEKAATAQELLSAAQRTGNAAGKELTDVNQLLSGDFSKLTPAARAQAEAMLALAEANGYATQKSNQLNDSQDKLRQKMEDWRATSKDASEGFIKDLINGKSAVEALGGALEKIGDKLLDSAFDSLFGTSGTNNWFSKLWSSIGLKDGGPVKLAGGGSVRGPGGPRDDKIPAMLSDGEFVVNAAATKKNRSLLEAINSGHVLRRADGGMIGAPSLPKPSRIASPASSQAGSSFTYAPVIDARGADAAAVARLEQAQIRLNRDFEARTIKTIRAANKAGVKLGKFKT
ncbi:tape measure domain-containing protein [Rhizobium sp. ERR 1071]|uniref:tape measure protein n=1 Tax=Rhizobium sp. ERR 1071 TaxID=2572677 RepID=UPI00119B3696|nr:tape measure protein [Rhizobium sp. ERR1071]TWB20039.1 tape measure domain-containing protein [Rhizobium sp. ERR1071]